MLRNFRLYHFLTNVIVKKIISLVLCALITQRRKMQATKLLSKRFILLFFLLISLSSCDWDTVIFYYDGTPQGTVATDQSIISVSYIYEGRDGTNYGPSPSKPTNIGKYKVSASGTAYDDYNRIVSFGQGTMFGVQSTNFEILPANSRISASITIDQAWVDVNSAGPWTISASSVTVTFGANLTITNTNQYFIISGSNVTIDGAGKTATISGVTNYPGLVKADASNSSTAVIKNIGLVTQANSTLESNGGWISQTSNKANIINCYSTGNITHESSGGITGQLNSGNITNCHSSGNINGLRSGGIAGFNNSGNISKCYSTGLVSGVQAGGMVGENNQGNISNCYTSGNISGAGAGGVAAYNSGGTISNCYTSGNISGQNSGGIAGYENKGAILNCYTSGNISGQYSGGIAGYYNEGDISNCRSSGTLTPGGDRGIILGIPSTGTISNSINVPSISWDNSIANEALTGEGTIWDTSVSPYTLMPLLISELNISLPVASLTSCLGASPAYTTFGVSGTDLTASVTISAPSGFEISTSEDGFYSSSITLTNTSTVSQTLHIRLSSSETVGTISGSITATSASNLATKTVSGTINAIPTISISESDASGSANNDSKVCIGGIATLTAIGGSTYSWSNLETASLINPSISSNTTYTVTGTTSGCSNTASITITVESLPSLSFGSISLSYESTYLITKTTSVSNNDSWTVSGTISLNNGYVTAGTTPGTYTVSYTDGCAQTTSATVTVSSTSTLPAITDGLASYKFNNNPQGPLGSGNVIYMGYNGYNYSSTTRPTNTGFYKANNVSGSNAGSPTQFYIFRCTTCPD